MQTTVSESIRTEISQSAFIEKTGYAKTTVYQVVGKFDARDEVE